MRRLLQISCPAFLFASFRWTFLGLTLSVISGKYLRMKNSSFFDDTYTRMSRIVGPVAVVDYFVF